MQNVTTRVEIFSTDAQSGRYIERLLSRDNHRVEARNPGNPGESSFPAPHLHLIDAATEEEALRLTRRIRARSAMPLLVVVPTQDAAARAALLDAGADDVVSKPLGAVEFCARVRALASRAGPSVEPLALGDCLYDPGARVLRRGNETIRLSRRDLGILDVLAANVGRVVTHHEILAAVWGPEYGEESNYLWSYVGRLRKKLGDRDGSILVNEPGVGYMLRAEPESPRAREPESPRARASEAQRLRHRSKR